jgi:dihydrolipoamide dehydrogenase
VLRVGCYSDRSPARILPVEDEEVSKAAHKAFEKRGLKFRVPANVKKLTKTKSGVAVEIEAGGKSETLEADVAIVAVGIVGNVEDMGLEALGVKIEHTHIVTDGHGATGVPGLYAIGDVAGPPWLAHKASHEGVHCIETIAGEKPANLSAPGARMHLFDAADRLGGAHRGPGQGTGDRGQGWTLPFPGERQGDRLGRTRGLREDGVRRQDRRTDRRPHDRGEVTEMIQGFALAMTLEATEAELHATVYPHPTMSEAMHEAALDAFGKVLHI